MSKIKCKGCLISNTRDTFGRLIAVNGVSLKRFERNPVILGWHDSRKIPIGLATKLTTKSDSTMELEFYLETELMPEDMTKAVRMGLMKCLSSGLNLLRGGYMYDPNGDKEDLTLTELSEASVVSIGRNADCIFEIVSEETETAQEEPK